MSLDVEPFVALYREYYGQVLPYARRRVDLHAADDVVAVGSSRGDGADSPHPVSNDYARPGVIT